jgi:hypothetical protein
MTAATETDPLTSSTSKRHSLQPPNPMRRSLSRASLKRKSAYLADLISGHAHAGAYDGEYKQALIDGDVGTGVRSWYSSFSTARVDSPARNH